MSGRRVARGNAAGGGQTGVVRVRAKLAAAAAVGNWYEAHQMYRTLYFRLSGQGKHAELEGMLFEGAGKLFDAGEVGSGVDLTKLYLDVLRKGGLVGNEELFQRVARLYSRVPLDSAERDSIMSSALQWSTVSTHPHGHPRLHQLLAHNLWRARRYPEARRHFLHACDGRGCGAMLAEFQLRRGYRSEVDLFVVGTVLQLICLRQHVVAAAALQSYTEKHPSIQRGPPYVHPVLNFVWLLLLAIEQRRSLSAFSLLVMKYQHSINRDPLLMEYLDKIGQAFFGVPAPERPRPGGLFSGLFDSFLGALNDDDEEEVGRPAPRMPSARRVAPASSTSASVSGAAAASPSSSRMETEDLD